MLSRRAADGRGPDPARTRGAAVEHQARAAGRDRKERAARRSELLVPTLLAAFPKTMQSEFTQQILGPPAAARDHRDQALQPAGQPHRGDPSVRAGRGGRHHAGPGRRRLRRGRSPCSGWARSGRRIETAKMPEAARIHLFNRASAALTDHMADLLRVGKGALQPAALVADLAAACSELVGGGQPAAGGRSAQPLGAQPQRIHCGRGARRRSGDGRASPRSRRRGRPCRTRQGKPHQGDRADPGLHRSGRAAGARLGPADRRRDEPVGPVGAAAGQRPRARLPA